MQNSFRWSLSHLLLPCLIALALLPARSAKADTVFDVSGTAQNISSAGGLGSCAAGATCPFSGTLTVDTTAGTVDAVGITFPGLSVFDTAENFGPDEPFWVILSFNSNRNGLEMTFTTTPTPGSLVGFTDGTIVGSSVFVIGPTGHDLYSILTGSITPVPEPSSLGILTVALLGFSPIIGLRKRKPVRQRAKAVVSAIAPC